MSLLPGGVYTSHTLAVDGRSVVTPDTGAWLGYLDSHGVADAVPPAGFIPLETVMTARGSVALPAGDYTSHTLTIDGRAVVIPDTGDWLGSWHPLYILAWLGGYVPPSFEVAGVVDTIFSIPPPQGFGVIGEVLLTLEKIVGTVVIFGSFECAGLVDASFAIPITSSFNVEGEVSAIFLTRAGQSADCITPDDSVPDTGGEENYVF